MEYTTTALRWVKSFPTYQFHAEIRSDSLTESEIFRRCVLETLRWIRRRLKDGDDIPEELTAPDPEDYASFSEDRLFSFTLDLGWKVDVTYVASHGIWAFALRETDMGANHSKPNERQPVIGRMFKTEISFVRCADCVECGVQIVVTEPTDCKVCCEVFRPAVVRALLTDPLLQLSHRGMALDAKPFMMTSKAEAERFVSVCQDPLFDYPLIVVAQAGFAEEDTAKKPAEPEIPLPKPGGLSLRFGTPFAPVPGAAALEPSGTAKPFLAAQKQKPAQKPAAKPEPKPDPKKAAVRLPEFPCARLAESTKGFGIVCYAAENTLAVLENKLHLHLEPGDIVICIRGNESDRYAYAAYSEDMEAFYQQLKNDVQNLPKHRAYDFGRTVFQASAFLLALQERRSTAQSLEESVQLYQQENAELKERLSELEQQETDLRGQAEELRVTQKRLQAANDEIAALKTYIETIQQDYRVRQTAYETASRQIRFYQEKAEIAAGYPTGKDEVCDWAEAQFPERLVITQRARSELRKYHGILDVATLCDALLYLDAYARTRLGDLTDEELQLYTDRRNWEVAFCGKEATRLHESDYTVTHGGKRYLLDMHLKQGTRAGFLIRIYFCFDEEHGRLIVGSMPEHLPTATQNR